jgi:type II secretory pathway predicted ATPase ExeA
LDVGLLIYWRQQFVEGVTTFLVQRADVRLGTDYSQLTTDAYTSYYNLHEEPFRLTSDPKFFHLAAPHAAALATLVEAVMRRNGFVLMSGPIGTGKTTVLHATVQILAERSPISNPIASAFVHNRPSPGRNFSR